MNDEKPKRERRKGGYVLQHHDEEAGFYHEAGGPFGSTSEAVKAARGQPEGKYRVIRVTWEGELKIEKVERRVLQ